LRWGAGDKIVETAGVSTYATADFHAIAVAIFIGHGARARYLTRMNKSNTDEKKNKGLQGNPPAD